MFSVLSFFVPYLELVETQVFFFVFLFSYRIVLIFLVICDTFSFATLLVVFLAMVVSFGWMELSPTPSDTLQVKTCFSRIR